MLKEVNWPSSRQFKTGGKQEPIEFYLNALSHSTRFDLLLGYFSLASINVLSLGFARFIHNGGKLRIIANHILSESDHNVLRDAREGEYESSPFNIQDIADIKQSLDSYGKHFFECITYLFSTGRIELKLIRPKDQTAISHYKSGVFYNGAEKVKFKGSCNFTLYGLSKNLEEVDIHCSWDGGIARENIKEHEDYFQKLLNDQTDFAENVPLEGVKKILKDNFESKDENELLVQEVELLREKEQLFDKPSLRRFISRVSEEFEQIAIAPRFPYSTGPREYQIEAYQNWVDNDHKGVFAMATGTGKTITSLNCVLNECRKSKDEVYHAFILVPTITLVEQWAAEAKSFNFQDIITVSSKSKWESRLATTLSTARRIPTSFIIIGTYASFIRERFNKYAEKLPEDTVFIADEAHNIGARSVIAKLNSIQVQKRIGLSATPKRIYDPEGSEAMERFFGDSEPYTYSFSMEKAISDGILCQYDYHPHLVELTSTELEEYAEITKKLARVFSSNGESLEGNEIAERLLLKRKRIIHKAENKLARTVEILQRRYAEDGNLQYTFVYVPEGYTSDVADSDEVVEGDEDNLRIISQYTNAIGNIDTNILVNQFVSGMPDRDEVLEQFKQGRIQVIASMKCLDEGVDIPRAEHAIFCSSTGNPRQFIQRRGRILRKHPDKHKAVIHDLVVIPDISDSIDGSDTFRLERNMVKKEIERVMYFASLSENPFETEQLFEEVCSHYDLNIYTIYDELKAS